MLLARILRAAPAIVRYAMAAILVLLTLAARLALVGAATELPFLPLIIAVLLAGYFLGAGPGLLAAILGAAAGLWLAGTERGLTALNLARLGAFLAFSAFFIIVLDSLWRARLSAEAAAAALDRAHQRTTAILQGITDGYIALDRDGRIAQINARAADLLRPGIASGTDLASLTGQCLWDLLGHDAGEELSARCQEAMRDGRPVHFEGQCGGPEGPWFEAHLYPGPAGMSVYVRDVTGRRRLEEDKERALEQLRAERAMLDAYIECVPVGHCFLDLELRYRRINRVLAGINSLPPEKHIGQRVEDVVGLEVWTLIAGHLRHVRDTGQPILNVELIAKALPDEPHPRYLLSSYFPVRDADGRMFGIGVAAMEITARKLAERALRLSEERLWLAMESASLGAWDYDPARRAIQWSERTSALFAVPPEQPIDYDFMLSRVHPEDRPAMVQATQQALDPAGPGLYEGRFRVVWPDGTVHHLAAWGRALFDDQDAGREAVRVIGVVREVGPSLPLP